MIMFKYFRLKKLVILLVFFFFISYFVRQESIFFKQKLEILVENVNDELVVGHKEKFKLDNEFPISNHHQMLINEFDDLNKNLTLLVNYNHLIQTDLNTLKNQKVVYDNLINEFDKNLKNLSKNERASKLSSNNKYLIVEYTKVFFQPKFCSKSSQDIFNSAIEKCPFSNCFYSCDKKEATIKNADLLIFHQRDLEAELEFAYQNNLQNWLQHTKQLPFKTTIEKQKNNPDQVVFLIFCYL
jgi:hypothetical protein